MASEMVPVRDSLYGFDYVEEDLRRAPEGERKTYDIKQFWNRHHEIVNLAAQGYSQVQIAQILHIHPQTVSNTLNSTLGKIKASEARLERDEAHRVRMEEIRVLTDKALGVYHEIIDNESGQATIKERKEVADTIVMELSGLRVPTKQMSVTTHMTTEDIAEFKRRGIESMREAGVVVDVEPEKDPNSKVETPNG